MKANPTKGDDVNFTRLARLVRRYPRVVIVAAVLFFLMAGVVGASVAAGLPAGGYDDARSESARAKAVLVDKFNAGGMPIVFEVTSSTDVADAPNVRARAHTIVDALHASRYAQLVTSYWTASPSAAKSLVSQDHRTGLVVAEIAGSDSDAPPRAHDIAKSLVGTRDGITVMAGGQAIAYYDFNRQARLDLVITEAIAIPFTFVVLVWVFGSAIAAILPIAVAGFAVAGTTAGLRAVLMVTNVSVFAINLATALCLALAIDYTLFIINRYREELAAGASRDDAMIRTLNTAGRTVLYSAVTVGLSLAVMMVFPMYFLRSLAYAGLLSVGLCLIGALIVAPALLVALDDRLSKWDIRKPVYHLFGRNAWEPRSPEETFFYRSAVFAMRRPVSVLVIITALLILLGLPFFGMKLAYPDDRSLPPTATAHQAGDALREQFPGSMNAIRIVLPSRSSQQIGSYADQLSQVPGVTGVAAPDGTYVRGSRVSAEGYGAGQTKDETYLTVSSSLDPYATSAKDQLNVLKRIPAPAPPLFGGVAQQNIDNVQAITRVVPLAFSLIAITTLVLIFLLTGSVLLPFKAFIMNMLSLAVGLGAIVWIFQDGHLDGFGTTVAGHINAVFPPFMFCVAFGLSMDYEVFVLSRIREEWMKTDRGTGDNERAVALGVAQTGRIVTAAATVMAIVFIALVASQVQHMRMLGVALAVTVLVDAFLIRTVLLPAVMRLMGRANWWAPRRLARWHATWGLGEGDQTPSGPARDNGVDQKGFDDGADRNQRLRYPAGRRRI